MSARRKGLALGALFALGLAAALALGGTSDRSHAAALAPPASSIVVGPPVLSPGTANSPSCTGSLSCTYIQWSGSNADQQYVVPVDGTIADWRVATGSAGAKVVLRVLRPAGGGKYQAVGSSAVQTTTGGANPDEFATNLQVKAGDVIGLDNGSDALLFKTGVLGAFPEYFTPGLGNGATGTPSAPAGSTANGYQLQVDAYVVPAGSTTTSTTTTTTSSSTGSTTTTSSTTSTTVAPPAVFATVCSMISKARLTGAGITDDCTAAPTRSAVFSAISTARWGIQVPLLGADHYLQIQVAKPVNALYLSGFRDSMKLAVGATPSLKLKNGLIVVKPYDRAQKKGFKGTATFIAHGYLCTVSLFDRGPTPPAAAAFKANLVAIAGSVATATG